MTYRFPHDGERAFATMPGHPEWQACNDGHIYRLDGTRVPERRKEAGENRLRVSCSVHGGYHDVARLIAEAFWGNQVGRAAIHKNGNTADNRPTNLEWVPQAGSNSNCGRRRRLNSSERHDLHTQLDRGVPKTRIAAALDISPRCVRHHTTSCRCNFGDGSARFL